MPARSTQRVIARPVTAPFIGTARTPAFGAVGLDVPVAEPSALKALMVLDDLAEFETEAT